jgi:hypothetical protein
MKWMYAQAAYQPTSTQTQPKPNPKALCSLVSIMTAAVNRRHALTQSICRRGRIGHSTRQRRLPSCLQFAKPALQHSRQPGQGRDGPPICLLSVVSRAGQGRRTAQRSPRAGRASHRTPTGAHLHGLRDRQRTGMQQTPQRHRPRSSLRTAVIQRSPLSRWSDAGMQKGSSASRDARSVYDMRQGGSSCRVPSGVQLEAGADDGIAETHRCLSRRPPTRRLMHSVPLSSPRDSHVESIRPCTQSRR